MKRPAAPLAPLAQVPPLAIPALLALLVGINGQVLAAETPGTPGPELRDGRSFDSGRTMAARAPGAPEELDRVAGFVGQWTVEVTRPIADAKTEEQTAPVVTSGLSEITFMNRGHALMERFHAFDIEGESRTSISFLGYNPGASRWWLGGVDNRSESAWAADGGFEDSKLVLSDTRRIAGGVTRTELRYSLEQLEENTLRFTLETSTDNGVAWTLAERRIYSRHTSARGILASASGYGAPDPERPPEASAFDFLIGEWTMAHDLTFPNGQQVKYSVNATAVHALDGAAVLEYNWFDTDPNLPDAATTIVRIYNRAMRRWESLYTSNRGNGLLVFGGRQEGDRIVLGSFAIDTSAAVIPRYIFHSMEKDSYGWYSDSSRDHGKTWTKTWIIQATRKPTTAPAVP